ncbi:MAG: N-methyltryptophan oxidase [Sphingobacteriales bacterium 50-39]|nr:N-methyl-L-tryptophan oxidase [Sphingobacteriales bacterium]OJW57930.1 MAG: N-methyltryptophan oxidase [Sphingobacteriales bacterium 50-39]
MPKVFDCMVVGLGANGSSTLYHLSRTGRKVIGIDRFTPPHTHGSSHGESRIIRQAYYEDPVYVPLLQAAYEEWERLEKASGKKLFLKTGGIMLGDKDTAVVRGSKLSADTHGIPYEYLDSTSLRQRFPAFRPADDTVGLLEKEAGILFPEECIRTFLDQAITQGAAIHYDELVLNIVHDKNSIEITTTKEKYSVGSLILSAGAWTNQLLSGLHSSDAMHPLASLPLTVKRQVLFWFANDNAQDHDRFLPANMPIYIWEYTEGKMFYGFPDLGAGIKIAPHHRGHSIDPDHLSQDVSQKEIEEMKDIAREYLGMSPVFQKSAVCMYTNTPDENFIIDFHPEYKNIIIASPCSGHGFKFSSLTGRILSDMAMGNDTGFDLSPFSLTRPAIATASPSLQK